MVTLKSTLQEISGDLLPHSNLKNFLSSYLFSARFRVLLNHRIGKFFSKRNFFLFKQIAAWYKIRLITKRGCDISYNSFIGKNVKMPHPIGIVIGDGVIIKNNVKIFQQVTFGSHGKKGETLSYPTIEENATIYAGAKIIGSIVIGKNAVIGANSVVNIDVPANSLAVGIPCKIVNK